MHASVCFLRVSRNIFSIFFSVQKLGNRGKTKYFRDVQFLFISKQLVFGSISSLSLSLWMIQTYPDFKKTYQTKPKIFKQIKTTSTSILLTNLHYHDIFLFRIFHSHIFFLSSNTSQAKEKVNFCLECDKAVSVFIRQTMLRNVNIKCITICTNMNAFISSYRMCIVHRLIDRTSVHSTVKKKQGIDFYYLYNYIVCSSNCQIGFASTIQSLQHNNSVVVRFLLSKYSARVASSR